MKTLGVVGGIGPESTIEYYRLLIAAYQQRMGEKTLPQIVISSIDVYRGLAFLDENRPDLLADYFAQAVKTLADAGADFAIISANTPHLVFGEVQARTSLPLLSIVEAACAEAKRRGITRIGLLGTRFTMQARFYPDVFTREGIAIVVPGEAELAYVHDKYINELLKGVILPDSREGLLRVIARMKEEDHIEAVLLAGTELPLILKGETVHDLPLLDTTKIHVEAAITRLLATSDGIDGPACPRFPG
jgi:aspartate racemase